MTQPITSHIETLCTTVNKTMAVHQAQANSQGESFNIFSILRMQRNETETHSRFIYELLSPNGRHGEKTCFLQLFLEHALGLKVDPTNMQVRREDQTEAGRRIDLTLSSPQRLIGIELKIDAQDQPRQLYDYYAELKKRALPGQQIQLYYLTLDGKPASGASLKGPGQDQLSDHQYQCLSFRYEIHSWLTECIKQCALKHALREAIYQYQRVIESLTGRNHTMSKAITTLLLDTPDNLNAALEIEKALQGAKEQLLCRFWTQLHTEITRRLNITPTLRGGHSLQAISHRYYRTQKNNRHIGFSFPVPGSPSQKNLHIDINLYHAIHYGLRFKPEPKQQGFSPIDGNTREKLRSTLGQGNAIADKQPDWINCFYYQPTGNIQQTINFESFEGLVREMVDTDRMNAVVDEIVKHIVQLVDQLSASTAPNPLCLSPSPVNS